MTGRLARMRDPFEGQGSKRRELRLRIEGVLALGMAIVACGLTAAIWIQVLAPLKGIFGLGLTRPQVVMTTLPFARPSST